MFKKILWFGVLLWVLMFVIISAFVGFGIYKGMWMELLGALIGGIISFILAGYVKPNSAAMALKIGLSFIVISAILDLLISMRFAPTIFYQWTMWVGYGLVLIAPFLRIKKV